jgi:hypothetical protein
LQGALWGVLAAGLLTFHPFFRQAVGHDGAALWAQGSALAILGAAILAAHLTYSTHFHWSAWPILAGALATAIGLSWFWDVQVGLLAALLVPGGVIPAAVLGLAFRRRQPAAKPAWLNLLSAAAVGLLAPACGLFAVLFYQSRAATNLFPHLTSQLLAIRDRVISHPTFDRFGPWCWPSPWVVGLVVLWALWRSLRRGAKQWRNREPPLAWQLTLAVVWVGCWLFFLPAGDAQPVPLLFTAMVTLLGVFLVADLWRGLMERLVLRPPHGQESKG